MVEKYAVVRTADGLVVNVVMWDGGPGWTPPVGHTAILSTTAAPGDIWDGTQFIRPLYIPTPEELEDREQPPLIQQAATFRDRTDYLLEPGFAALPALASNASANQTRDYIIANIIPRVNALSTGANAAVPRINVNTRAVQGVIKVLLYLAKRLMGLNGG